MAITGKFHPHCSLKTFPLSILFLTLFIYILSILQVLFIICMLPVTIVIINHSSLWIHGIFIILNQRLENFLCKRSDSKSFSFRSCVASFCDILLRCEYRHKWVNGGVLQHNSTYKSEQWARFGLGDMVVDSCPWQGLRALEFERNLANFFILYVSQGGSDSKESPCNAGDSGLIPGLGRSSGERNGRPLQCSCLENPLGTGTWRATVHGVAKSWTRLSDKHFHTFICEKGVNRRTQGHTLRRKPGVTGSPKPQSCIFNLLVTFRIWFSIELQTGIIFFFHI